MRRDGALAGLLIVVFVVWEIAVRESQARQGVVQLAEDWGNLEGTWLFATDAYERGEERGWQNLEFDDTGWRKLTVPGWWEPQGVTDPRPGEAPKPKKGVPWTDYDGTAWYRLRFLVPQTWAGQDLVLWLGTVDDYDRTFFNGRLVGETGREVVRPATVQRKYLVPAEVVRPGRENVLAIRVTDGGGPGGLTGQVVSLLPKTMVEVPMKLPQSDRPLRQRFVDPPADARILKIIHDLPDSAEAQEQLIKTLTLQGFGGMVCNVPFDGYLESEEKWRGFVQAVKMAKEVGMSLWLYDEHGYPSGVAYGITMREHPEWEAQGLLIADIVNEGGHVEFELPPGEILYVKAFPISDKGIDLGAAVRLDSGVRERKLMWDLPRGRWYVMAVTQDRLYENTHAQLSLADKLPYINLLMPEPTARFLQVTHEQYARRLGDDMGRWFVSTFTDEPSLMSMFLRATPYRVLPWAPQLGTEFRKRRGYSLEPLIPALVTDAGGAEQKVRYDFWLTVGELVAENFFGQIQEWCRKHKIASGGHLLMEESITAHVPLYGDFFRCVRRLDAPSIDCLTSIPAQVPWQIARLISSAAELDGKEVTMCETSDHVQRYRPQGDERPVRVVTEDEIRGTCNRLIVGGINTITSYYSFASLNTAALRRLNEWVGRCCTMLRGGHQVTDVAMVYPIESLWVRHVPARQGATDSSAAWQIQKVFNSASEALYAARRDFTYVDSQTVAEAKVDEGALVHGDLRWRVVVLPAVDTMPMAAWENLARFWRAGGVVISLHVLPANSETDFPSARVAALAEEMFGREEEARGQANQGGGAGVFLPAGAEFLLPLVLDRILEPDFAVRDSRSPLRYTHRHIDGHEVYFVINDSGSTCTDTVALAVQGEGELWNPATGKATKLPAGSGIKLEIGPYMGVFLRFPKAGMPRRKPADGGVLPGLRVERLPVSQPTVVRGEFVRSELLLDADKGKVEWPAWRAVGTLAKSQVDTFLFVCFDYKPPLDLSAASCIVVDTWVPQGQKTPSELLVILRDADGADYIAGSGRSLGAPGHCRSFVPLTSFRLAGWSKDTDGRLDLEAITGIRIGWGGYYGAEGEVVEFIVGSPQIAR